MNNDADRQKVIAAMGGRLTSNDDAIINRVTKVVTDARAETEADMLDMFLGMLRGLRSKEMIIADLLAAKDKRKVDDR